LRCAGIFGEPAELRRAAHSDMFLEVLSVLGVVVRPFPQMMATPFGRALGGDCRSMQFCRHVWWRRPRNHLIATSPGPRTRFFLDLGLTASSWGMRFLACPSAQKSFRNPRAKRAYMSRSLGVVEEWRAVFSTSAGNPREIFPLGQSEHRFSLATFPRALGCFWRAIASLSGTNYGRPIMRRSLLDQPSKSRRCLAFKSPAANRRPTKFPLVFHRAGAIFRPYTLALARKGCPMIPADPGSVPFRRLAS